MSRPTMFSDVPAPTKTVVLDTSVLVADPDAIHQFEGCALRIPLTAIEELDGLKTRPDAAGQTAREALRGIEALRITAGGSLVDPLKLAHGGTLAIVVNGLSHALLEEHHLDVTQSANRIIGAALGLQRDGAPVEVVSNDAALRIKAAHLGLAAKEYVPLPAYGRHLDSPGWHTLEGLDGGLIDTLFSDRSVEAADVAGAEELHENEF
nr:PIN domain-containing protein [Actinomycetota bacterium]